MPTKSKHLNSSNPGLRPGLLLLLTIGILTGSVFTWQAGSIAVKAHLSQWLLQAAWQKSLASGVPLQPWPSFDSHPVARLYTDTQRNASIVLDGSSGQALAFGPTLLLPSTHNSAPFTAQLPMLTEKSSSPKRNMAKDSVASNRLTLSADGLIAIAGHRDTHMRFLEHTSTGQQIGIETLDGHKRLFSVVERQIIDTSQEQLMIDPMRPGLLLVTCYPFNATLPGGPLRLIVYASPLENAVDALPL